MPTWSQDSGYVTKNLRHHFLPVSQLFGKGKLNLIRFDADSISPAVCAVLRSRQSKSRGGEEYLDYDSIGDLTAFPAANLSLWTIPTLRTFPIRQSAFWHARRTEGSVPESAGEAEEGFKNCGFGFWDMSGAVNEGTDGFPPLSLGCQAVAKIQAIRGNWTTFDAIDGRKHGS